MSIQLTRRELYEMIWTRPTTKVAADLGISDVALHKICEKHRIPSPGRGYWAKLAAGKSPKRALFRDVSDPLVDRILIQGSPVAKLPPEVQEARAKLKAEREQRQIKPPLPVPSSQSDHPVFTRLAKMLTTAKADKDGFIRVVDSKVFAMTISPAATARALVIAERLVTRADVHACRFDSDPGGLRLVADGEPMTLHLVEQTEKIRHQPTDAEVNVLRKWEADRVRRQQRGHWSGDWDKPAIPEWDHAPSGLLVFELDRGGGWDGLRRRFADSKRKRLEDMVEDVFTGALVIAAARKAKRVEDARRQEEAEKEAQRRREAERRRVLQQKRIEVLDAQLEIFAKADRIEDFLKDYLARNPYADLPESCRRFIDWAQGYAEAIRQTASPEALGAKLDAHRLMDDATEISSWVKVV